MKFEIDQVFEFLKEKGVVATMRNYTKQIGEQVIAENKNGGKILAEVVGVFLNQKGFRKIFYKISGFNSLEQWEAIAEELHKGKLPDFVIILRKRAILETVKMKD